MASIYNFSRDIRIIDPAKWKEFDGPAIMELQANEQTWLSEFSKIRLPDSIPTEVMAMFEISRGAMVYSFFYYPLATLGSEHCFRTVELAVRLKAGDSGAKRTFEKNLKTLVQTGVILEQSMGQWDAARDLRNRACHPDGRHLIDPDQALRTLRITAELLASLYPIQKPPPHQN